MKKKEITAAILLFFAAVALFYYAAGFPVKSGGLRALNPGFYPKLLAVFLACLSVVYFFQTLRKTVCASDQPQKIWVSRKSLRLFLTTAAALIAYPFVLNFAGFATAGFLFLTLLIYALTEQPGRNIPRIIGISAGLTILMFGIFKVVLRIPFPQGLLI